MIPLLDQVRSYDRLSLRGDLTAGLTVAVMLIPQGMAYALIAGLPPIYGLYAALVPIVVYALLHQGGYTDKRIDYQLTRSTLVNRWQKTTTYEDY